MPGIETDPPDVLYPNVTSPLFLVAEKTEERAILYQLCEGDVSAHYGSKNFEVNDSSFQNAQSPEQFRNWQAGDILLYSGNYSKIVDLPSRIYDADGTFEKLGVLPERLQDVLQWDGHNFYRILGDETAVAELYDRYMALAVKTTPELRQALREKPDEAIPVDIRYKDETFFPPDPLKDRERHGTMAAELAAKLGVQESYRWYSYVPVISASLTSEKLYEALQLDEVIAAGAASDTDAPQPDPEVFTKQFIVLNKQSSNLGGWAQEKYTYLTLIEIPAALTDASFMDGAELPTCIIVDNTSDPLFRDVIGTAEAGDVITYTGRTATLYPVDHGAAFYRMPDRTTGTYATDEHFEKSGNVLTDDAYAEYRSERDGKTYITLTTQEGNRYILSDGLGKWEPLARKFIVLNKRTISPHGDSPDYHVLSLLEIPLPKYQVFDSSGWQLPTYYLQDTRDDPLVNAVIAEAEYGDVIEISGGTWCQTALDGWNTMFRETDPSTGAYEEGVSVSVTGSALTDEVYANYRSIRNQKTVLTFTSQEGDRYFVFPDCLNTQVPFVPESSLPDLGDINDDGVINASDAATMLYIAALVGAGQTIDELAQAYQVRMPFADVDGDGIVNASDAALVLQYAAYCGAERHIYLDLQEYLYEQAGTVKRVSVDFEDRDASGEHTAVELLTSPEELETYFTEIRSPFNINTVDWLRRRDTETVRSEIMAAYPAEFFEKHHLVVLTAHEMQTDTCQLIRSIKQNEDGTVTIDMHHLDICGQPLEGMFAVLVAVDKSITDPAKIMVNETYESRNDG